MRYALLFAIVLSACSTLTLGRPTPSPAVPAQAPAVEAYPASPAGGGFVGPRTAANVSSLADETSLHWTGTALAIKSPGTVLPLAGGTMGDAAIQSFTRSQASGDSSLPFMTLAPVADAGPSQQPKFTWLHERALFTGVYDHVVKMGWNLDNQPDYNAAFGRNWISFESNYLTGGAHTGETHLSMAKPGGAEVRVFSAGMNWTTGKSSVALGADVFKVQDSGGAVNYIQLDVATTTITFGGTGMLFQMPTGSVYGPLRFTDGGQPTLPVGIASEATGSTMNIGVNDSRIGTQVTGTASHWMQINSNTNGFVFNYRAAGVGSSHEIGALNSDGAFEMLRGVAVFAGGSEYRGIVFHADIGSTALGIYPGSGAPTLTGRQGALYLRDGGGAPYFNADGGTTWTKLASTSGDAFTGLIDMSGIAAGSAEFKVAATSDTPTTTYTAHVASTDPSGFIKITVGASSRYIPYFQYAESGHGWQ